MHLADDGIAGNPAKLAGDLARGKAVSPQFLQTLDPLVGPGLHVGPLLVQKGHWALAPLQWSALVRRIPLLCGKRWLPPVLYLVGTDSGDSLPHEMSYLTVIKLQYTVTLAQESGFNVCAPIFRFPQQCPS